MSRLPHINLGILNSLFIEGFPTQSNKTEKTAVGKSEAEKILRTLSFEQGFHFATDLGKFTGETAISLFSFYEELRTIETQSVKFHFLRRDFQKWVEIALGDQELASRIDNTASGLTGEDLKRELLKTVQLRLTELQKVSNIPSKQTIPELSANASAGELKKFTLDNLKQFTGQAGSPVYFVFEGKVYDASASSLWSGGLHMAAHEAGKDLTEAIKSAPHGDEVFVKVKQVGVLV